MKQITIFLFAILAFSHLANAQTIYGEFLETPYTLFIKPDNTVELAGRTGHIKDSLIVYDTMAIHTKKQEK